jgi:lysine 2,3-aminomutase
MSNRPHGSTLRKGADFVAAGLAAPEQAAEIDLVAARYAVAMTPLLAGLVDDTDPGDPIARQFLPDRRELDSGDGERPDPIGDLVHTPVKGIVHRYPDRVLLMPLLHCPVYCRFCFRRERVGSDEKALTTAELASALDYIRARPEIWEVVITGGDPLLLPTPRLAALMTAIEAIGHVQVIRLHSRVPIADPDRIDAVMLEALRLARCTVWLAIHCNHAREFTESAAAACRRLSGAGIPLVGQTVLLKGVNDQADRLEALFRAMVTHRIKPYYLHQLDLAPGTGHFRTPIDQGQALMRALRGRVSGLCQPTYVLDLPGGHGKVPIGPGYLDSRGGVTDWQGRHHLYPPAP